METCKKKRRKTSSFFTQNEYNKRELEFYFVNNHSNVYNQQITGKNWKFNIEK